MHKQLYGQLLWLSVITKIMSTELDKILECHRTTAVSCTLNGTIRVRTKYHRMM